MLVLTTDQNSNEWFSARCGIVTASRVADAMRRLQRASGKKKAGDWHGDHEEYVRGSAWRGRCFTGIPAWHQVSMAMQYGIDHQQDAIEAYAEYIGEPVKSVGLIRHPSLPYLAASPDGLLSATWTSEV